MENKIPEKLSDLPVLDVLAQIKNGLVNHDMLDKQTRQSCVEVLIMEGYSQTSIAGLFKTSDRTIRRDLVEIRRRNAVASSPELTKQLVGEFIAIQRNYYASLKQIARIKDAYPDEKTRAEAMAWKGAKELIEILFWIGYISNTHGYELNKSKINRNDEANLSQEDKEIRKRIQELPPMEREKLMEKLREDIHEAARKKELGNDSAKNKTEETPPPEPTV